MTTPVHPGCRLPSPPGVGARVLELCRQDESDLRLFADVIMADPALSARLLRFANSPALGPGEGVPTVRDAVLLLGMRATKLTALGFTLPWEIQDRCPSLDLRSFWSESLLRAVVARHIVAPRLFIDRELAFSAALLARIGKLVLAQSDPAAYEAVLRSAQPAELLPQLERERFGADHVATGARQLAQWGLPRPLAEACEGLSCGDYRGDSALAQTVHCANRLIEAALGQDSSQDAFDAILHKLGMSEAEWQAAVDEIDHDYQAMTQLYETRLATAAQALELLSAAQDEATRIGVTAQLETAAALRGALVSN